ncbi:MAG: ABC transporter ATP-binding protein [Gammaproteobacteria bacterium]|nr:ABC transporter ATP-binding protein [Gammaproteobacteria bacterium]MCY4227378.1 ABC transporter ATP-binding protein [Gammaproteobacteria bacterium]
MENDPNKIEPSIYRFILKHTTRDQILILLITVASMPVIYGSLEVPKIIINSAINGSNIPEMVLGMPMDQISYLLVLCLVFLILVLIAGGLKYLNNVYRGVVGERMLRRFRYDLYCRVLRFPNQRFKHVSQAEILPMITAETEPLGGFIGDAFALPAFQGGLLLTYLLFIFNQDFWLGLAAIALYPPQIYLIPKLQAKVNQLAKQRVQAVRHLSDKIGEGISGVNDIHLHGTSRFERAHISTRLGKIYHIRFDIYKRKFFIKFLNNFLGQLTPFFFYSIGGYFVIKGQLSLGALVAVLAAYKDLSTPWRELLKFYQITEDVRVKYSEIIQQFQPDGMLDPKLQEDQDIQLSTDKTPLVASALHYSEDEYVKSLDGVSVSINPGDHVAILGPGGSGRGNLAKLLVRLIEPDSGQLKIGDSNLSDLSEVVLGRKLAYVDSSSFVFNDTVYANLFYGLKYRPVQSPDYSDSELAERKRDISDSEKSGNAIEDVHADWVDLESAGLDSRDALDSRLLDILNVAELGQDIYQLGLYATIDPDADPEFAEKVMQARHAFRDKLASGELSKLVELLEHNRYNMNLSVAENLFFGTPIKNDPDFSGLINEPAVQSILDSSGLGKTLFGVGIQASKVLSEIFSGVPEGSPLFERFSFVESDQLPILEKISKLPEDIDKSEVNESEVDLVFGISMKLTVAQHRLGLINEPIQEAIVAAHLQLREALGENNELIEFYNRDHFVKRFSIQDNILFGRIVHGQVNARDKVGKLMDDFIEESGLRKDVLSGGFNYRVGVAGARLTANQRQKLAIARALVKNPDILVFNDALAAFDRKTATQILSQVLSSLKGKTVIWILNEANSLPDFDRIVLMDKGKVLHDGTASEIQGKPEALAFIS